MALQSSSYSSKSKTRLQDDMTDKGDDILTETFGKIHWFHELESTMDEVSVSFTSLQKNQLI